MQVSQDLRRQYLFPLNIVRVGFFTLLQFEFLEGRFGDGVTKHLKCDFLCNPAVGVGGFEDIVTDDPFWSLPLEDEEAGSVYLYGLLGRHEGIPHIGIAGVEAKILAEGSEQAAGDQIISLGKLPDFLTNFLVVVAEV